jgi:diguanylate cyclase (GGDEF)-like protein/PAS domain S-box-containing protein
MASLLEDVERLAALEASKLLDSPPDASLDQLTISSARLMGVPTLTVSLLDDQRQYVRSQAGVPPDQAVSLAFCRHIVEDGVTFVVEDASKHAILRDHPAVTGSQLKAFAGVPIVFDGQHVIGVAFAASPEARAWSDDDLGLLRAIAGVVVREAQLRVANDELRARLAARHLTEARILRERIQRSEELVRALARSLPSGSVTVFDHELRIVLLEGGAARAFAGAEVGATLGRPVGELTASEHRDRLERMARAALTGEEDQAELVRGNRTFFVRVSPVRDDQGQVTAGMAVGFDITERRQAEQGLLRQTSLIALLQGAATASNEAQGVAEAMTTVLQLVDKHTGWPLGHVYRWVGANLEPTTLWHDVDPERHRALREASEAHHFPPLDDLPLRVVSERRALWVSDLASAEWHPRRELALAVGLRGTVCFPVRVGDEVVAVLEFFMASVEPPDPRLLALMDSVGVQLGRVVERERAQDLQRALAMRDELTGLYNRRGFTALAEQQLRVASRAGRRLVLLFCDVDGLKPVNDKEGHEAGDRLLREAAQVLLDTFRTSDVVARLGGDEFVVLTSDASELDDASLRRRLEIALDDHPRLSFSIGVAIFDPLAPRPLSALIVEADSAMYGDKRRKRAAR